MKEEEKDEEEEDKKDDRQSSSGMPTSRTICGDSLPSQCRPLILER